MKKHRAWALTVCLIMVCAMSAARWPVARSAMVLEVDPPAPEAAELLPSDAGPEAESTPTATEETEYDAEPVAEPEPEPQEDVTPSEEQGAEAETGEAEAAPPELDADVQPEPEPAVVEPVVPVEVTETDGWSEGICACPGCGAAEPVLVGDSNPELDCACECVCGEAESRACACSGQQALVMAQALDWDGGLIVFSGSELVTAAKSGQYAKIYLGFNDGSDPDNEINHGVIQLPSGGAVITSSLTIDGTDPRNGHRMKLIDCLSSSTGDTLRAGAAGLSLTLQNVDVDGYNYYGILFGDGKANVAIQFLNVDYTGRQMVHNAGSGASVHFSGCNVTLTTMSTGAPQELAEAGAVTFAGANKVISSSTGSAVIWTENAPYSVTVNGSLTVDTANYFLYTSSSANTSMDVPGTLHLTTSGSNGCVVINGQYIGQLTVPGTMTASHQHTSYASLYVKTLTVSGALTMSRTGGLNPLIAPMSGGSVTFSDPSLVQLTNPGHALIQANSGTASLSITARAINLWRVAAGDPYSVWNNQPVGAYAVTGTVSSSSTLNTTVSNTGLSNTNVGVAPGAPTLNGANFDMGAARKLALGRTALSVDAVRCGGTIVSGHGIAGADISVSEYLYALGVLGVQLQTAPSVSCGADGRYVVSGGLLPLRLLGSRVYVRSDDGELICYVYADPEPSGTLSFYDVPDNLSFGTVRISERAQRVGRELTDWAIQIEDTRTVSGTWQLYARLNTPFAQGTADLIDGALVYREGTASTPLSDELLLVAQGSTDELNPIQTVRWAADQGMLLELPAFSGMVGNYSAIIEWRLVEGP